MTDEPMQRAVFFDLGGVIVREDDALYDEFGVAHGLEPGEFYRVMYESTAGKALRLGRISREVWFEAVVEMLRDHWGLATEQTLRDWWNRPPQLHGRVLQLAVELQKAGVRIEILSNASGDLVERLVSQFGVELDGTWCWRLGQWDWRNPTRGCTRWHRSELGAGGALLLRG